jgi:hypothetical protein
VAGVTPDDRAIEALRARLAGTAVASPRGRNFCLWATAAELSAPIEFGACMTAA